MEQSFLNSAGLASLCFLARFFHSHSPASQLLRYVSSPLVALGFLVDLSCCLQCFRLLQILSNLPFLGYLSAFCSPYFQVGCYLLPCKIVSLALASQTLFCFWLQEVPFSEQGCRPHTTQTLYFLASSWKKKMRWSYSMWWITQPSLIDTDSLWWSYYELYKLKKNIFFLYNNKLLLCFQCINNKKISTIQIRNYYFFF